MSEGVLLKKSVQQSASDSSLLYSDILLQVLGGDALQLLKCGICMDFFDIPIVLPCGHTFCLQCLTGMCRQAGASGSKSILQDQRIGCPNCRVLVYTTPIIERNVTCNFTIQSLVECLKTREAAKQDSKGTNTDESKVGTKIRSVSDLEIQKLSLEVDRLSESLGKRSVVDNAFCEIEQIRNEFLAEEEARKKKEENEQISRHRARSASVNALHLSPSEQQLQQKEQAQKQSKTHQLRFPQPRQNPFGWSLFNPQTLTNTTSPTSISSLPSQPSSFVSSSLSSPLASATSTKAPCHQLQSDILNGIRKQISINLQRQQIEQQQKQRRYIQQQRTKVLKQPIAPRLDQPCNIPSLSPHWHTKQIQSKQPRQQDPQLQKKQEFPSSKQADDQQKQQPKSLALLNHDQQHQVNNGQPNFPTASDISRLVSSNFPSHVPATPTQRWPAFIETSDVNKKLQFLQESQHAWTHQDVCERDFVSNAVSNTLDLPEPWSFKQGILADELPLAGSGSSRPTSQLDQDPAVMTYSYKATPDKTGK